MENASNEKGGKQQGTDWCDFRLKTLPSKAKDMMMK